MAEENSDEPTQTEVSSPPEDQPNAQTGGTENLKVLESILSFAGNVGTVWICWRNKNNSPTPFEQFLSFMDRTPEKQLIVCMFALAQEDFAAAAFHPLWGNMCFSCMARSSNC